MTIASEFDKITVKLGGSPSNGETVAAAIDALNDALAGSDQPCAQTVEQAVALLGEHISAGGGGGGDFTTATVKMQAAEGFASNMSLVCPCIASGGGLPDSTNTTAYTEDTSMEFTAVLYKGRALAYLDSYVNVTATGSVEYDQDLEQYYITGDCTFTFSAV